jgi:alanine dehydrogenase
MKLVHPRTYALSNATLPYILNPAVMGAEAAARGDPALAKGVNTHKGHITYPDVAEACALEYAPLETLL